MNKPITSPGLPNLAEALLPQPDHGLLATENPGPPRIFLLYGSLRPQSFSRTPALEASGGRQVGLDHLGEPVDGGAFRARGAGQSSELRPVGHDDPAQRE